MTCPNADTLAALETLSADERSSVDDHIASCEACRKAMPLQETAAADVTDKPISADPVQIDRYRVERRLGAGAMGVVYAAHDSELDRRVAVKLMKPRASADRLRREAQTLAKLSHANIVTVHDVGVHAGAAFVAMELVDGENLRTWLQQPRTTEQILDKLVQATRGIIAAHAEGVVHRDLKPDNIFVSARGDVLVGDFGLARSSGPPSGETPISDLTASGAIMGTPAYMSPESFEGDGTPLSDQFALCVTMWEALYGARPFQGTTLAELLESIKAGPGAPPETRKVSQRIHAAIARGLAADPAKRFGSVAALLAEITYKPPRWPYVAAAIVAAGIAGTVYAVTRPSAIAVCNLERDNTLAWSPARRDALEKVMVAKFPKTGPSLAKYADCAARQWLAVAHDACKANAEHRLANPEHAALARCLERRAEMFKRVIDVLPSAVDPINARAVIDEVVAPEQCRGVDVNPSPSPKLVALQQSLDVNRLSTAVRVNASTDETRADMARRAVLTGDLQIQAEVEAWIGDELAIANRPLDAVQHLRDALALADRAHDDRLRAVVGGRFAALLATIGRIDEARVVRDVASSAAERSNDASSRTSVKLATIEISLRDTAVDTSLVSQYQALIASDTAPCGPTLTMTRAKINLALQLHSRTGPEAEAAGAEARALLASLSEGNDSPELVLAQDAITEGDRRRRIEKFQRLIPLLGPDHPLLLDALQQLATDLELSGDYLMSYRVRLSAIEILGKQPQRHGERDEMLVDAAAMALEAADASDDSVMRADLTAKALAALDRAEQSSKAPDKTAFYRGRALYQQGRLNDALPFLQRGVFLAENESPSYPGRIAARSALLARALWDTGDREHAKGYADAARTMYPKAREIIAAQNDPQGTMLRTLDQRIAAHEAWYKSHFP